MIRYSDDEYIISKSELGQLVKDIYNTAIEDCIKIAYKYMHSDAHNMEIDEMEELKK